MGRTFGILATPVVLVVGAAVVLMQLRAPATSPVAPQDSAFCSHVSQLRLTLIDIRSGASAAGPQLLTAQQEFQADSTTLAASGQSVSAATAAGLSADLAQWRQAVVTGDAVDQDIALNNTLNALASAPAC